MDFKLERVALALRNLGDPHRSFRSVHIAGTNGKGSVAAMVHSMFWRGGYRVGLYTSPHLIDLRERIVVADSKHAAADAIAACYRIGEDEVVSYTQEIHAAATVRGIPLTFFEVMTVMAFLHFARQQVDLAVIEVGLGGRLDATNVIDPEVAVITSIGLDHQEFLGESLAEIAAEKAGILKAGCPGVVGVVPKEALDVIEATARARGIPLARLGKEFRVLEEPALSYEGSAGLMADLEIGLRGSHQRGNAAVALRVVEMLAPQCPLPEEPIRLGLREVRWPGRLDVVRENPKIILDGAHNEEGMTALAEALPELVGGRPVILLFAVMRDKRWQAMVEKVAPLVDGFVVVQVDEERGETVEALAAGLVGQRVWVAEDAGSGMHRARSLAGSNGVIVVAGSLSLVGAVYRWLDSPPLPRLEAQSVNDLPQG